MHMSWFSLALTSSGGLGESHKPSACPFPHL